MALVRLCPFCLEPAVECVCPVDEPDDGSVIPGEDDVVYHVGADEAPVTAEGLTILRTPASGATETAPHAAADDWTTEPGPPYRGVIAIEWPAPAGGSVYACMLGRDVKVADAVTGKPITTCLAVAVHADPGALVTADLTMFADEDGEPLLDGDPVADREEILTGTFPFVVAEMRVRQK